ncbi:hypothetical protein Q9L58_005195 [Maublancomyces gigas]|uniref:Uncharacterized protein n=1 Tax=Discina gigas TaxID=1032678 RepID=A0ABR3GJ27_9PEZI
MQLKSIILSLVASVAVTQAASPVEYATYEVCRNELDAFWGHYGYAPIVYGIDAVNAIHCGICISYAHTKCFADYVCGAGTPELHAKKCYTDAVTDCKILAFETGFPYYNSVSGSTA